MGVAAIFATRLLNGNAPRVFEDGRQMRDFVSVQDAVHATLLAAGCSRADGRALNIGSGEPTAVREIAVALARALKTELAPVLTGKHRAGDIRHCFADIAAARDLLGYVPRISLAAGVKNLVE